jgi:hypothetical protein
VFSVAALPVRDEMSLKVSMETPPGLELEKAKVDSLKVDAKDVLLSEAVDDLLSRDVRDGRDTKRVST